MSVIPATVRAYFASPETRLSDLVILVPTWVVSGPREPASKTSDDLALCAVGLTLDPVAGEALGGAEECDVCGIPASAWDEGGTAYCARCLIPGGDTYGVVQSRLVEWVEWDEVTRLPVRTPDPEPEDRHASL